jgi:signal transduction histidine kinase
VTAVRDGEARERAAAPALEPERPAHRPGVDRPGVDELLVESVRLARQGLGVDHASLLLLDAERRLVPKVSIAREDDHVLWARFRAMPPLGLDAIPVADAALTTRVMVIDDVASSDVIPPNWLSAFAVKSAAIAPLVVDGRLRGALIVDHTTAPHVFTEAEVRLLDAMAGPLRHLLRVADTVEASYRRDRLLDDVVNAAGALNAARTPYGVLQTGMEAALAILGAASCSVNVVRDDGDLETVCSRGLRQPEPGRHAAATLAGPLRAALAALGDGPRLLADDGLSPVPRPEARVVLPLPARRRAFLLVGLSPGAEPEPERLDLAAALCVQAAAAYDRVCDGARLARRVQYLETLHALMEDAAQPLDLQVVLERLAPAVRSGVGGELIDAFLCDAGAARAFAASTPPPRLAAQVRAWRREPEPGPVTLGDLVVVPMLVQGAVDGVLRVRPAEPLDDDALHLLLAVAAGIGGLVARAQLRKRVAETERDLAVAAERERVGRDLHDTLGQQLFALRMELEGIAATAGDPAVAARLRDAVGTVSRATGELRQAINALSFLEHPKRGLVGSLRALVRELRESSGIDVDLRVTGAARAGGPADEALFRVAHEALTNVARHSGATSARVTLRFAAQRTTLVVRDDGRGLPEQAGTGQHLHFGLRTMQRRVAELGGGLDVANAAPSGVRVHAWVPVP